MTLSYTLDRLTQIVYNDVNDRVRYTYDAIGNPLSYYNGKDYTFTWEHGRQLASAVVDGKTINYEYSKDGIRTSKTIMGEGEYSYLLDGSQVVAVEVSGDSLDYTLRFTYDASGSPLYLDYVSGSATTRYYYITNLQGDVVKIVDQNNATVAEYLYDAWGKVLSVTETSGTSIGAINPIRYRGYFYDSETGLYYCNSRYYDPEIRRWINADAYASTGQGFAGFNMFAYCGNNPVMFVDPSGMVNLYNKLFWGAPLVGVSGDGSYGSYGSGGGSMVSQATTAIPTPISPPKIPVVPFPILPIKIQRKAIPALGELDLVEAKVEAKTETQKSQKPNVHHIVAQNDRRATEAREILCEVGINPRKDPRNLVSLPQHYHVSMHTNAYYIYITERLRPVAGDLEGVECVLAELKLELIMKVALKQR